MEFNQGMIISLGISVLLIAALGYYFYSRFSELDHKVSTLFTFVQNEAEKNKMLSMNGGNMVLPTPSELQSPNMMMSHTHPEREEDLHSANNETEYPPVVVSDGESESESDDESSDDDSDVSSTDGSASDDDSDGESDSESVERETIELSDHLSPSVVQLFNQATHKTVPDIDGLQLIDDSDDEQSIQMIDENEQNTKEINMHSELMEVDNLESIISVDKEDDADDVDILDDADSISESSLPNGPIDPNLPPLVNYLEGVDVDKMKAPELREVIRKYRLHVNPKNIKKKELIDLLKNNM
jgi:hypothetical protein